MRVVKGLASLLVALLVASVMSTTLALYLALNHRNLPVLRALVTQLGRILDGQNIEALQIDVRLAPESSRLTAVATVSVRATTPGRRHLYFLLNDGLRVEGVWLEDNEGDLTAIPHYRLGPLGVVTPTAPPSGDNLTRLRIAYGGNPSERSITGSAGILRRDDVVLKAEHLWYPTDLQGFFSADVRVTLPGDLALLHSGRETERRQLGDAALVRWVTPRPVAGMALVAGRYAQTETGDGANFHVALADGVDLDPEPILSALQVSDRVLGGRYGPSGFDTTTIFVNRSLDRAFNDGAGLIGISPRYFSDGDYGFATVAHEVAHNWWGGTVAEKWLRPGTGGEWIVEGFAEFSSLVVVGEHLGEAALLRQLEGLGYDPTRSRVLADMSVLDNALDPEARPTIYHKGAQATRMLQLMVGEEPFFMAARRLFERFGYRQASDADVEVTFAEQTERDLSPFFSTWIRSDATFDLALDPEDGGAVARNHGTAWAPAEVPLWRIESNAEHREETAEPGTPLLLGQAERILLDPTALTADMYRENNVFPPRATPRLVATSSRGDLLIVTGEPHPWSPATVVHANAAGEVLHTWSFDHGVHPEPRWAADGLRILAVETDRNGVHHASALNVADGSRKTIAREIAVTATADALIVARGEQLLRVDGRRAVRLVRHRDHQLSQPLVSPDQQHVAYVASASGSIELRIVAADGTGDHLLFSWPRSSINFTWAASGTHLFAALPGDWDWQLWEIPTGSGTARALVREAAMIGAVTGDREGGRVAFTAIPYLDATEARYEVFVLDRGTAEVQRFDLDGSNAESIAWRNSEELLVVVSNPSIRALPRARELRRLSLSDGSLTPFP
jgi:hypothetical protein